MDDPAKPPAESPHPTSSGLIRSQLGDPEGRPELVTALALLDRGDLRGAARVLETSGVHNTAAMIRLEHATGPNQSNLRRIAMLREGCAQNPGDTEEGKALHRALAEALLRQAETMTDGAPMRALLIEAGRALEHADRGTEAGMIYERLALWRQAAQAYEAAGAISNLEYALEVIEHQEAAEAAIETAEKAVDEALRLGHRRLALTLLSEHTSDRFLPTEHQTRLPRLGLVRRMAALEDALARGHRLHLAWPRKTHVTVLHSAKILRIGRSPDIELPLAAPTLSRDHVHLQLAPRLPSEPPGLSLLAVDQGSKVGTFWQGQALEAGVPEPLTTTGELGLGFTSTIEIHPLGNGDETHGA
ncbi:MAG TPA: FHA domain-containing protein, partial [Nannocystis exedens]|nr:FHA domain-containing protein [Nannocystis exedens]